MPRFEREGRGTAGTEADGDEASEGDAARDESRSATPSACLVFQNLMGI